MIGQGASYEFRWRRWALLRDTVAAHLEDGKTGTRFPRFASIGDALLAPLKLPARELHQEIAAMRDGLGPLPITALVLGEATAAVLYIGAKMDAPRPLTRTELAQIAPIGDTIRLGDYFLSMFTSIIEVCDSDSEGMVEVIDG